jgi:tRNA(adenine34) deaminase
MQDEHQYWMKRCFELAHAAEKRGENPVGSLLVRHGALLAEATESTRAKRDVTAHAETEAIRLAVQTTQAGHLSDATLYTSREPCLLCAYVIRHYRISQVVYAERGGQRGSVHGTYPLLLTEQIETWGPPPRVVGYDLVEILDYLPRHQTVFQALNEAWIREHFRLDPVDVAVLSNPEEHILRDGGRLFMARYNGRLVGTCGLLRVEASRFEFTKMAVEKACRGKGLGKALARHALSVARRLGARQVELYTQKVLPEAIGLYRQLGFREIPLPVYKYTRADTYMVLDLG